MGKITVNASYCPSALESFRSVIAIMRSFFFRFWQKSPSGHGNVEEAWKSFLVQELVTCSEKDIPIHFLMEMPTLTWSRLWWRVTSHSCLLKFYLESYCVIQKGFLTLYTLRLISIFSTLSSLHLLWYWQGDISLTIGIFQWKFFTQAIHVYVGIPAERLRFGWTSTRDSIMLHVPWRGVPIMEGKEILNRRAGHQLIS